MPEPADRTSGRHPKKVDKRQTKSQERSTNDRSSDMKLRIIRTGARLFAKKGYHGTGVQELGDAVGLGRGALYHHIESKDKLLYEISSRHIFEMVKFGEEVAASDLPPDEKFRKLSRQLMRMISENLEEITVFFHEYRSLSKKYQPEIIAIRREFEDVWHRIITEGVEAGMFRPMHPVIVKGILGLHNYSYIWLEPKGDLSPEEIADAFSDLALEGLRAR